MRDARRQHARLAGAGAGQHQHRAVERLDGGALLGIEHVEITRPPRQRAGLGGETAGGRVVIVFGQVSGNERAPGDSARVYRRTDRESHFGGGRLRAAREPPQRIHPQRRGEIRRAALRVDPRDQRRQRAAVRRRDALQRVPEGLFQRDAGAMAGDDERVFFDAGRARSCAMSLSDGRVRRAPADARRDDARSSLASASLNSRSIFTRPKAMRLASAFSSRTRLSRSLRARRRLIDLAHRASSSGLFAEGVDRDDLVAGVLHRLRAAPLLRLSPRAGGGAAARRPAAGRTRLGPGRLAGARPRSSSRSSSMLNLRPNSTDGSEKHVTDVVRDVERFRHRAER